MGWVCESGRVRVLRADEYDDGEDIEATFPLPAILINEWLSQKKSELDTKTRKVLENHLKLLFPESEWKLLKTSDHCPQCGVDIPSTHCRACQQVLCYGCFFYTRCGMTDNEQHTKQRFWSDDWKIFPATVTDEQLKEAACVSHYM